MLLAALGNWLGVRRAALHDRVNEKESTQSIVQAPSKSLSEFWREGTDVFPIIQSMTSDEAEAAFLRAARFESGYSRERIREWTFDRWAESDPTGALNATGILLPEENRFTMISPLVQRWAVDDPDACLDWIKRQETILSQDELKSKPWKDLVRAVDQVRNAYPPTERELARAWELLEQADEGTSFNAGVARVDDEEVQVAWPLIQRARETGEWAATMSRLLEAVPAFQPAFQHEVIWPVIHQWLENDFDAATAWVAALPPGQERDNVIGAMTRDPHGDPHAASFDRLVAHGGRASVGIPRGKFNTRMFIIVR